MGCTVRALGADGLRAFEVYLISEVFGKVFREIFFRADSLRVQGGWSEINLETYRTVRSSGRPGERPAACPRTVGEALANSLRGPGG
jgi:hypothetical protein